MTAIQPTILWALSLAMLGGALFGLAFSLRPPAGRACMRGSGPLPGSRKSSGEGAVRQGHRVPSPVFVLAAARYGAGPSYAAGLAALRRVNQSVTQSESGRLIQQPARRPGGLSHL